MNSTNSNFNSNLSLSLHVRYFLGETVSIARREDLIEKCNIKHVLSVMCLNIFISICDTTFLQFSSGSYLDSFDPLPPPGTPLLQSLDSIPTYKNEINDSGIT